MADADEKIPLLDTGRKNSQNEMDNDGSKNPGTDIDNHGDGGGGGGGADGGDSGCSGDGGSGGGDDGGSGGGGDGGGGGGGGDSGDGEGGGGGDGGGCGGEDGDAGGGDDGGGGGGGGGGDGGGGGGGDGGGSGSGGGGIKCVSCSYSVPIEIQDAKPGDHIKYKSNIFYHHHAIVDKIDSGNNEVWLIHYWNRGNGCSKPKLQHMDVPLSNFGGVKKIEYNNSYDERKRREKAQNALTSAQAYNLFFNNCEHFCHFVCTDRKASKQVRNCGGRFRHFLLSFICSNIPRFLRYLLGSMILIADDLVTNIYISGAILLFTLSVYFVYVVLRNSSCCNSQCCNLCELCDDDDENICPDCLKRGRRLRWIRFAIVTLFQLGYYALSIWMRKSGKSFLVHVLVGLGLGFLTAIVLLLTQYVLRKRFKKRLQVRSYANNL